MSDFKDFIGSDKGPQCPRTYILALTDTLNVVSGKWKLPIIAALLRGVSRFKDLLDSTEKITPRMLSKELKELEMNSIVERKVYSQTPVLIEYKLTKSGKEIANVIDSMIDWGMVHRTQVITDGDAVKTS
ncbi:winged helix-turn-helix transcriptional regulator [Dyadobacter psychrophilus]|uniref:Transcriptional regulator, HxlR family n=1 Tax=Dyadobacter psychrophilus TaxID=651661 RepID=A0A1T5G4X6_9BACT|nr:helix-turn-helix domain-containing protein [Dyadobacter psychrophilus]SKC03500.1 transcriptional regulator, HxlR family [Dyadobacter psychrophilus]